MSPKTILVSGRKIVKTLNKFGYEKIGQKGSHIKIKSYSTSNVLIIPDHTELDRWTLKTILKQAEISDKDFNDHLRK